MQEKRDHRKKPYKGQKQLQRKTRSAVKYIRRHSDQNLSVLDLLQVKIILTL